MTHKGKPEVVFVAISQPDGNVAVMQFITMVKRNAEDPGYVREATPENIEAEMAKSGFGGMPWSVIEPSEIPQDRGHRGAWTLSNGKIAIDPAKASAIDEKRKLDAAVDAEVKAQREALVASVKARLK
jgi:hypothetical protein